MIGHFAEAAQNLADKHYAVEPEIAAIFLCSANNVIRLLEVTPNTIASAIMPLRFDAAPASGIHFPSEIIEVTPGEYHEIIDGKLALPEGWKLGHLLARPEKKSHGGWSDERWNEIENVQ